MYKETKPLEQRLNEGFAAYAQQASWKDLSFEIHKEMRFDDVLQDKMLMIHFIRMGIPYALFDLVKAYAPFTENDWAEFLELSTKSLQRYKLEVGFHFKPAHSEKILEIAEVTKVGLDVLGTMDALKQWLSTPCYALGAMKPAELLKDSYGKNLVIDELIRMDHGIFV